MNAAPVKSDSDNKPNPLFSLKWKVAIWLTLFLLVANAALAYIGYLSLERQFENQLQRSVLRSTNFFDSLLKQARINLQNLGESLALDNGNDTDLVDRLGAYVAANWDILQLNWGLQSAEIFDANGNTLKSFGTSQLSASNDLMLLKSVAAHAEPATIVDCSAECLMISAVPILLKDGGLHTLILKASIADFIIDFSSGNVDGSALLRRAGKDATLPGWGYDLVAATNRGRDIELLKIAERQLKFDQLLGTGVWFRVNDQHYFNLHAITLDQQANRSGATLLVLIEDISAQRNTINEHIRKNILTAGISMIVSEMLLLLILWGPMRRIKKQAEILPLLASGNFLKLPIIKPRLWQRNTRDELDILEESTIELSNQLEKMSLEINSRAQKLEYMALYDHLTELANRRLFLDHLTQAAYEYERSQEKFAVLFFDLDNFKRVNDSFGHDVGDELLKKVAKLLRENTRATDTVARLSGDEFTVLLQHIDDSDALLHLVEKIRLALQIPVAIGATQIMVTPSIGIVIAPDNGLEPDQLLRNADVAMYEAKRSGGNSYYFFTEEINYRASQLLRLENELREALDQHQFFLLYQPLVDLLSMQIVGLEALARWQHPQDGVVSPEKFIGVMENNGMIIELGAQVIAQACRDLAQLHHYKASLSISINLSPRQLRDCDLVETLEWQLRSNHVDPRRLKIEITENSLIEDVEQNIEILNQLKEMGLALSIDDFGTGYSSLSYLKMLPVDELKVDRGFINDLTIDRDDREITAAVIAMAHKLQLKVVAEGIETTEQLDFLRRNHCDTGQGYLFSKPVPLEDIQRMLQEGIAPLHHRL